jgi:hypothetical protein
VLGDWRGAEPGRRSRRGLLAHAELGRRHPGPQHALGGDRVAIDGEAAEGALQILERQAGVEQRSEHHVAGNPRKAVEVQNT